MRPEEIEKKLKAFYEGKTTRAEEKALFDYFETCEEAALTDPDRRLLAALGKGGPVTVPEGLEQKISETIDARAFRPAFRGRIAGRRAYGWVAGIAASLLIAGILGSVFIRNSRPKDTFTDPRKAYTAAAEALAEISENLNKGIAGMEYVENEIRQTDEKLKKQLR